MKKFVLLILFFSSYCQCNQKNKVPVKIEDDLFILKEIVSDNSIRIIPPKNQELELPDSSAEIKAYKRGDFNADGKDDVLVSLGGCGTGGCMYGLFLKQNNNYYKLALMDYLKNAEFKIEKSGFWSIESSEEIEPYNPSKTQITIFKFDKEKYKYKVDTTFIHNDK